MIECSVWSGFTVCKNSLAIFLGITKSQPDVPEMDQPESNKFCKISLSFSLSLWKALSYTSYKFNTSLSCKLFALTLLEK